MDALRTAWARVIGPALRAGLRLFGVASAALGACTLAVGFVAWTAGNFAAPRPAGLDDLRWQLLNLGAVLYLAIPLAAALTSAWLVMRAGSWCTFRYERRYWKLYDQREKAKARLHPTEVAGG